MGFWIDWAGALAAFAVPTAPALLSALLRLPRLVGALAALGSVAVGYPLLGLVDKGDLRETSTFSRRERLYQRLRPLADCLFGEFADVRLMRTFGDG